MATELNLTIRGETALDAMKELAEIGVRAAEVLGVAPPQVAAANTAAPAALEGNGADKPATTRKRAAKPDPTPEEKAKLDRAAIIDGLTKIYSKGDEDVRLAITKFRDGQGADRLRDLKDDALPAAAELLTELKLAAESPAV